MKLKFKAILLGAIAACSSVGSAITVDTLAHLKDTGASLSIGDKTFSGFDFTANNLTSFDPTSIQAKVSIVDGIYFLTWAGNISVATLGSATGDLKLSYTVSAAGGAITSIDQNYAGGLTGGIGSLSVKETVKIGPNEVVATSTLGVSDLSDPVAEPTDDLFVNPGQSVLNVLTDIDFSITASSGQLGLAVVSELGQSFHQENKVPDAGSARHGGRSAEEDVKRRV